MICLHYSTLRTRFMLRSKVALPSQARFDQMLQSLGELCKGEYCSRTEFVESVVSRSSIANHDDLANQRKMMLDFKASLTLRQRGRTTQPLSNQYELGLQKEHVLSLCKEHEYLSAPSPFDKTTQIVFQIVCANPSDKSYLQRCSYLAKNVTKMPFGSCLV